MNLGHSHSFSILHVDLAWLYTHNITQPWKTCCTHSIVFDQDSVIDSSLTDACEVKSADWPPGERAVTLKCPHGDKARRTVRRLDKMLLRLQTELRVRRIERSTLTLTSQVMTVQ